MAWWQFVLLLVFVAAAVTLQALVIATLVELVVARVLKEIAQRLALLPVEARAQAAAEGFRAAIRECERDVLLTRKRSES